MEPRDTLTPSEEPRDIEQAIDGTRHRLASTLTEIEHRLSPAHLRAKAREATIGKVENMARNVRYGAETSSRSAMQTLKDNPIPAAMVGIGLTWLFMNRSRSEDRWQESRYARDWANGSWKGTGRTSEYRAGENGNGPFEKAADYGREKVEQVKEGATHAAERIKETAGDVTNQARERVRWVEDRFTSAMEDNPLALGAVALALGFAFCMAIPRTEKEDELFGSARDRLLEKTESSALNLAEKGEEKLSEFAERTTGGQPQQGAH